MKKLRSGAFKSWLRGHPVLLSGPTLFAGAICLIVCVLLTLHLIDQHRYINVDDALVQSHFTPISAKAAGIITQVWVREHDAVRKGQLLAVIDVRPSQASLDQALATRDSEEVVLRMSHRDFGRAAFLHSHHDLSDQAFDQIKMSDQVAEQNLKRSNARTNTAEIQFEYTQVLAPADGVIAECAAVAGMEVRDGTALFGLVYPQEKWVIAKVKEIDLQDVHIGQSAEVRMDAIPKRKFEGKILSISPTTEGIQAAIPPDNGAGNFTKYVQRVPVKIALELSPADQEKVRTGLSADVILRRTHE